MKKYLKTQLRLMYYHSQPSLNVQSSALTFFRTEQFSNDYVSSLCKKKLYSEALVAFDLQKNTNFRISPSTYARLISACSSLRALEHGRKIHDHILHSKCQPDIVLHNHILTMYSKCGSLEEARVVFYGMSQRNVVSWTALIAGYSQNCQENDAVKLYFQMLQSGIMPDHFTFGSIVKACSGLGSVHLGRQLHAQVIKSEHGSHLIAQNALISMYKKFDDIYDAWEVFCHIETKDITSWSSMIAGFCQLGFDLEALCQFKEMLQHGGCQPNEYTFGSALSACTNLVHDELGSQIHNMCIKFGFGRDIFVGCSLCDMYSRSGFVDFAIKVFNEIDCPDLASWNAIIAGIARDGSASEAMSFFSEMRHLRLKPDGLTVRSLLCACTSSSTLYQGMQVHSYIIKTGFDSNVSICNAILTMYSKCSVLCNALLVFKELGKNADLVSWNLILAACLMYNQAGEVIRLFCRMLVCQNKPDHVTLRNVMGACAELASLEMGNQLHCYVVKNGFALNILLMNGLIDMFIKGGSPGIAQEIFNTMEDHDVASWSSLIVGYAQFGCGEEALRLFRKMRGLGVRPNHVTFVGVLTACSHVGLVEEGLQLYRTMENEFGIIPTREHLACVVDLLARAGRLIEAECFINQMAFDPDIVLWNSLLAACKTHGNVDVAERAAKNILNLDPTNSAAHVLLCNIFASSGKWEDVARLRASMKERSVRKVPGKSWIEIQNKINVFLAEDSMHPEREKIYAIVGELWLQMLDDVSSSMLASTTPLPWLNQ